MRLKSALRRGVAAAVIAGIVVSSGIPAYAGTWDIADGNITVRAGEAEGTNRVTQGEKDVEDTDTVITGESEENTVTIDTSKGNVDVTFDDLKIDVSGKAEVDGSGDSPVDAGKAAVTVQGDHDATIELDGDNELKSGGYNAGLEKDGHEPESTLTIKDDKGKDGSLTAEGGDSGGAGIGGGMESTGSNIKITGGTIEAVGGEGAAGIGGGVYGTGRDIEISGGKVSATGGDMDEKLDPSRPGAAGIGDGAGTEGRKIDPDAPPSNPDNPNHIIISGDAEVEAKAGASTGGKTAAIGGGDVGEISNDALSSGHNGSLTRYDPDGNKKEDYSYDRRTPSQPEQPDKPDKPEQPDDTENNDDEDDEDDAPDTQAGEVPGRVKQMYEAMGVITHPDGTQELADVTTAEYDPVNKVLRFDAHGSLFWMTGDSLRELAKEVDELRVRFLDGEGQEMEAVIPLARIKDLVGAKGAFEFGLYHEGIYRFHVVGQTGYDREMFSREREKFLYENVLRENGKELVLVYHVGDEEEKAQETARVEEAIARRRQEKEQWWGVVISGLEGSLSGQPDLTQPGTGAVGDLSGLTTLSPDSLTTAQQPKQPASDQTVWKTFTGNIVKLAGGKQDSKKDDPAPSVGDLSGLTTLSPDSLTAVPQPETSAQQPETGGWVTDSQGDWVWKPGKADSQPPDLRGNWETRKWMGSSDDYWWEWQPVQEGDQLYWKPILQTRIRDPFYDSAYWKPNKWVRLSDYSPWDFFYDSASSDSAWMYDYEG